MKISFIMMIYIDYRDFMNRNGYPVLAKGFYMCARNTVAVQFLVIER